MKNWLKRHLWDEPVGAYSNWRRDDGPLMSAAVAYYGSLSFFPLMSILVSVIGLFLKYSSLGENARRALIDEVAARVSPALGADVEALLGEVGRSAWVGGFVGLLFLLMTATILFTQFDRAFDRIWSVPPTNLSILETVKRVFFRRLRAFLMLLVVGGMVLLLLVGGFAVAAVDRIAGQSAPWAAGASQWLEGGLAVTANAVLFAAIYKWLPKARVRGWAALRGGVAAALVWEIGRRALTRLVGGQFSVIYGLIGSFLAIMLWMYYAAAVIFLGAEYVKVINEFHDPTAKQR